jgi:anti-sigma B factor antagonist
MTTRQQPGKKRVCPDTPFTMSVDRRPTAAVVTLTGSCTMDVSGELGAQLIELASGAKPLIVLELSGLDFIESTGLGGIVAGYLRCRRNRGEVRFVAPQPSIHELLELTRLTQLFRIFDTIDAALAAEMIDP